MLWAPVVPRVEPQPRTRHRSICSPRLPSELTAYEADAVVGEEEVAIAAVQRRERQQCWPKMMCWLPPVARRMLPPEQRPALPSVHSAGKGRVCAPWWRGGRCWSQDAAASSGAVRHSRRPRRQLLNARNSRDPGRRSSRRAGRDGALRPQFRCVARCPRRRHHASSPTPGVSAAAAGRRGGSVPRGRREGVVPAMILRPLLPRAPDCCARSASARRQSVSMRTVRHGRGSKCGRRVHSSGFDRS
jgi:hypothetical protein